MTKVLTREDVIAIVIARAENLAPDHLRRLVDELPTDVKCAIDDFSATVDLSRTERNLLLRHNISIPWELMLYAEAKEQQPNIKVEWPPRNK